MSLVSALWLLLALAFVALEFFAVGHPGKGDTFTEHLRPLLRRWWAARIAGVLFWLWLGFHFFLEGP